MCASLSLLVVFSTVYSLIIPAVTMEETTYCGLQEHTHDESCYEKQLVCTLSEEDGHVHTDDCYQEVLACTLGEHTHGEECYVNSQAETADTEASEQTQTGEETASEAKASSKSLRSASRSNSISALAENAAEQSYGYNSDGSIWWQDVRYQTSVEENTPYIILGYNGYKVMSGVDFLCTKDRYGNAINPTNTFMKAENAPSATSDYANYSVWYFESTGDGNWYIYIKDSSANTVRYLKMGEPGWRTDGGSRQMYFVDARSDASVFFLNRYDSEHVRIGTVIDGTNYYINTAGGDSASCYGYFWGWRKDEDGSRLRITNGYTTQTSRPIDTVSPSSTNINLFDFWSRDNRYDSDLDSGRVDVNHLYSGINKDHEFKFSSTHGTAGLSMNQGTSSSRLVSGIVKNKLGSDGYPVLSGDSSLMTAGNNESLAYLFNPSIPVENGKASYRDVKGLLTVNDDGYFYYNSHETMAEFKEETNKFTIYDRPGVYPNNASNTYGEFFPFNSAPQVAPLKAYDSVMNHYMGLTVTSRFVQQFDGYKDSNKRVPTSFYFSGDDDVWVFIDGVLVADLGGKHTEVTVEIDFSDGSVKINGGAGKTNGSTSSLKQAFTDAGEYNSELFSGNTFADNTTHTLKFFYLERGNYDSNLVLRYNLNQIPPNSINKIDQYGDKVDGARFAVYKADKDYYYLSADGATSYSPDKVKGFSIDSENGIIKNENNEEVIKPVYCDVTRNGEMVFTDEDDMPYSMSELKKLFGEHFILKEIGVPGGYRTVSDDIQLRIENGQMLCSNTYLSGVWARANAQVTASNTLHVAEAYKDVGVGNADGTIDYYDASSAGSTVNGTLFAVVLKRNGGAFGNVDSWYPIRGSADDGYIVSEESGVSAAIDAAKASQVYGSTVFSETPNGMQVTLENLPGKIQRYFTYMEQNNLLDPNNETEPQYFVAYYYTTGALDKANAKNTVRVISREGIINNYDGFQIRWGTTIGVPNIENRLFFQKNNQDGVLVNNAAFALYNAYEAPKKDDPESANYIYYTGVDKNGNEVYVGILSSKGNYGDAIVFGYDSAGNISVFGRGDYKINTAGASVDSNGVVSGTDIGKITVTVTNPSGDIAEGSEYYVYPAENADGQSLVGATHDNCGTVDETGTGHFTKLVSGKYYLREIIAPPGYVTSPAETPVLVDNNGVYAFAGKQGVDNGVHVGNGVGYLVKSLNAFASRGQIDETLSWVYGALIRNDAEDFTAFAKVSGDVLKVGESGGGWKFVAQDSDADDGYGSSASLYREDAMVSYLEYNNDYATTSRKDTIFDYTPNSDQNSRPVAGTDGVATLNGEGTLLLFTEYGWSDMAIYQDYAHGISQLTTLSTTNYDDLTRLGNISNLFSSSTWVRVTDETCIDLTVKKIAYEDKRPLPGAGFLFYSETALGKSYYSYQDGETVWISESAVDSPGALTLTSGGDGTFTLKNLSDGIYYLYENAPPGNYEPLANPVQINIHCGVVTVPSAKEITVEGTFEDGQVVIVPNSNGYRLPETGGTGKIPYIAVGLLLMSVAAALSGYKWLICTLERRNE